MTLSERIRAAAALRSGTLWRGVLERLPPVRVPARSPLGIPLVTMCGAVHVAQLEQMLATIAHTWSRIPDVVLVSDGTLDLAVARERLRWWPAGLEIAGWDKFRDYHRARGRLDLSDYADKDVYGRKLSTILAMSEGSRILWCDCDLLFFRDFARLVDLEARVTPFAAASADIAHAYDAVLTAGALAHLSELAPVNTGVVLCQGNLYDGLGLRDSIRAGLSRCMYFTEQTILASVVVQTGGVAWNLEQVHLAEADAYSLAPTFRGQPWFARHYVKPVRHLFWRDALALRFANYAVDPPR